MNIIITGASRGIGKAVAEVLGYDNKIFATGRNEQLLSEYENFFVSDLSNEDELVKLGEYIVKHNIDVLINNAGMYEYCEIQGIQYENVQKMISVNLMAPIYLISRAIPYMKEKGWGRIVNIGSISGVMGEAGASVYSASKSGLIGMTKSLALELAQYGITVNTINPGWVDTDMGNSSSCDGGWTKEEIVDCIPQRRFVSPCEIAGMVKYLISDEARGVTGQSINLCAGLSVGC